MTEPAEQTDELDLNQLWDETDDDGVAVSAGGDDGNDVTTDDATDSYTEGEEPTGEDEEYPDEAAEEVDYKALYERERQEKSTAIGRLKATEQRWKQEQDGLQAQQPVQPPPVSEEDQFLEKFRAEYSDDVLKAIDLITSRKASSIVETALQGRLAPIEQTTYDMVAQAHFGAIEAAHPDVDDINASPAFEAWLETRPAHIRGAYYYTREKGSPAEVISMLNEYKEATGQRQRSAPAVSRQKVDAATAVSRRRGTVQTTPQAQDGDLQAIWNETDD
jgi:hypothetical protein